MSGNSETTNGSQPGSEQATECPQTPRSSEQIKRHVQDIMDNLDELEYGIDSAEHSHLLSPIRKKVQQLASSAVTAMAGMAIQTQNNTQLRASIQRKKSSAKHMISGQPGDRTQLTKARVLDSAEAQRLKERAEARAIHEAAVKQQTEKRKQEKVVSLSFCY